MRFSKSIYGALFCTLVAVILCGAIARGLAGHGGADWGDPVNGLQISISQAQAEGKHTGLPVLQVNLYNSGKQDLYTIPGMLQDACAPRNLAGNFKLTMTDSKGTVLRLGPPFQAICEGVTEAFVLPMPAGTTFSIPIDLNAYSYRGADRSEMPKQLSAALKPGEFSIQAEYSGTAAGEYDDLRTADQIRYDQAYQREVHLAVGATMEVWRGTIRSNSLHISFAGAASSTK